MKKTIIVLSILSAFFAGMCLTSLLKKEKVIFVHKQCDEGKCISNHDLYMIGERLKEVREVVITNENFDVKEFTKVNDNIYRINQIIK